MNDNAQDWTSIRHALCEAGGSFAACLLVTLLLFLEIVVFGGTCAEDSFVEAAQVIMLFISAVIFFRIAHLQRDVAGGLYLVGGFLLCMAIRELDWFTDRIPHMHWSYVAWPAAGVCCWLANRNRPSILKGLGAFARSRASVFMTTGFLCVLVFSRLFGSKHIWDSLYDVGQVRTLKNVVEEGLEMFGDALILSSSVMVFAKGARRQPK